MNSTAETSLLLEIEQVNDKLSGLLTDLKSGSFGEPKPLTKIGLLDDLLHQAIVSLPHMVNGVEVRIQNDINPMRRLGGAVNEGREYFASLIHRRHQLQGIVLSLPYHFSTWTHGSGERLLRDISNDSIQVLPLLPTGETGVPILSLQLSKSRNVSAGFPLDEIESIRLTNRDDFIPEIISLTETEGDFLPPVNPTLNYIRFRRFASGFTEESKVGVNIDFDVRNLYCVFFRDNPGGLWNLKSDWRGGYKLKTGFLVYIDSEEANISLLEITDVRVSSLDSASEALQLYSDYRLGKLTKKVIIYEGRDIIKRLALIPATQPFEAIISG